MTGEATMTFIAKLTAILLAIIGLVLLAGGARLAMLGGSPAYLAVGLGCIAAAILLWRGRRSAVGVYWSLLVAIWGWSIWEVGFDGWGLMPRVIAPTVMGLWLLTPLVEGKLVAAEPRERRLARGFAALCAVILALGLFVHPQGWARNVVEPTAGAFPTTVTPMDGASADEWKNYGGDPGGTRFSALDQLTPANVKDLKVAWTAHLGSSELEVTPLKIGDTLYACSALNQITALDPETGKVKWSYDPKDNLEDYVPHRCRGVAYFDAGPTVTECRQRVFTATLDARLIAVDATNGKPCQGFGDGGIVDLKKGMGETIPGYYAVTSAPTVIAGKVIFGGYVTDNQYVGEPSGVVRAYDAVTGQLSWAWDVGRTKDTPADAPFTPGTPNVWGPISGDEKLGLVYLPTGNATPDYWGGERTAAEDAVSSSVIAVDAATGATRWVFQTVHHDVWDYDVSPQPTLLDVKGPDGAVIPALLQTSKRGQIFLLDRRTGVSLTKIVEKPVPQHGAAGEHLSPTQPYSVDLPTVDGPNLTERDMWGLTPFDQLWCRIAYRQARYEGQFTPPGADPRPSIQFPGFIGGVNWGGVSVDPEHNLVVLNTSRLANYVQTIPRAKADAMGIKPVGLGPKHGRISPQVGTPFAINTFAFLSPIQVPCQRPPFGMITVLDLASQKVLWSHPLGSSRDVGPFNWRLPLDLPMGAINLGGTLTTRGGLIFVGATQEQSVRAVDIRTGEVVWKARLPASGQATPMTYRSSTSGRQFVVIAAGGSKLLNTAVGDYLVAYALPEKAKAP
jgi:quinoprotein glucose dehydrogenase